MICYKTFNQRRIIMTQFDFNLNNTTYKAIYDACVLAENSDTPSVSVLK